MPRRSKPLSESQRIKAQELRTAIQHALVRNKQREAEIRRLVMAEAHEDNVAAWRLCWQMIHDGASPTLLAEITGVSRATLYLYANNYAESMAARGLEPEVGIEPDRRPWEIVADGYDEFVVTHPELGVYHAKFEDENGLVLWQDGVYRPIYRDHPELSEGDWTTEHELLFVPLVERAKGGDELYEAPEPASAPEEAEDGLSFLDDEEEAK